MAWVFVYDWDDLPSVRVEPWPSESQERRVTFNSHDSAAPDSVARHS